ncbi:hypothetical protein RhiJN_07355 [Ceratobasidium sp. AG-Ba]|nr:hypothetical protein RhiJN_07355 [Ceratobasidium sp. AG-Ba]QRW08211.1 hypothetical protein RhiLY_07210 [Ceratobasidium sp. AG-Ba]
MSKHAKRPPKLSAALFSAAGVSAGAPTGGLPPSPSAVNPTEVHDAHVKLASPADLVQWKTDSGQVLGPLVKSVVVRLPSGDVLNSLPTAPDLSVIAYSIPYPLSGPPINNLAAPVPISYSFTFDQSSDPLLEALRWASDKYPADLDVQVDLINGEQGWESLEDLISKTVADQDIASLKPIVLSNILPPPGALAVPTVKLLAHPMYLAYQAHVSSLSFTQNVYLKFLPPDWHTPTPQSPLPGAKPTDPDQSIRDLDSEEKKEWKRRAKMYLGPAVEAFGYSRILFGSSPTTSNATSNAGDWYQIAKECVAELGVDQEGIDAVFGTNAKAVYGA